MAVKFQPEPGEEVVHAIRSYAENEVAVTSIQSNGNKSKTSKRLYICNPKETYRLFKIIFLILK